MFRLTRYTLPVVACLMWTTAARGLEAGAAKLDITPELGTPLNGYDERVGRGATVVHDPIWARCLYLEEESTRVFLVSADLFFINRELRERVWQLSSDLVPGKTINIILVATHTHNGPGGMSKGLAARWKAGRFVPDVLERTAQGIRRVMELSFNNRQRAAIGYGIARQRVLSRNRTHRESAIDTQVGVVRVDTSDGFPIAIVANFAAHPTTAPREFSLAFSADYPGYFYAALEKLASEGCIAMFLNGATGDQICADPEDHTGWEMAESIGRLLAIRAKEVSNGIRCREAPIAVRTVTRPLPRTLFKGQFPDSTILQTLEIDDLLMTFFPAEPVVEVGLEMRRIALERGYRAQFTVGLSNDYLGFVVPEASYSHPHEEAAKSFYGPDAAPWFYREFGALMTRGVPRADRRAPGRTAKVQAAGVPHARLEGPPYARGYQRGQAFQRELESAYRQYFSDRIEEEPEGLIERTGRWKLAPPFVDHRAFLLPELAAGMRTRLARLSSDTRQGLQGMADGAGLSFDALWLTHCASAGFVFDPTRQGRPGPSGTMFAVVGDRAGADGLFVGRTLDWDREDNVVALVSRDGRGKEYFEAAFPWQGGTFTAMNDTGIVLCMEQADARPESEYHGPPVELLMHDALLDYVSLPRLRAFFESVDGFAGYRLLAADPAGPSAIVLEFGDAVRVRLPQNGLLMGADPRPAEAGSIGSRRYGRLLELFSEERIIGLTEVQSALADREADASGAERIFNESTRHAVAFVPGAAEAYMAYPDGSGALGPFRAVKLGIEDP